MRWERLFDDLEAQAKSLASAELEQEVSERSRIEVGRLRLVDRCRAAIGQGLEVRCDGVGAMIARLDRVGADWLLLTEQPARQSVVSLSAVTAITGLGSRSTSPGAEGPVVPRLTLRHALRGLARDRAAVQLLLVDGSTVSGTIDRVGADFAEVAEHAPGEARRAATVRRVQTLPLHAVAVVRTQ